MAAAAQTVTATVTKGKAEKKTPGWKQLLELRPYVTKYPWRMFWGMLALLAGGLVGALSPLAMGTIVDALSGSRSMIARFTLLPAFVTNFLLRFYQPFSRE